MKHKQNYGTLSANSSIFGRFAVKGGLNSEVISNLVPSRDASPPKNEQNHCPSSLQHKVETLGI